METRTPASAAALKRRVWSFVAGGIFLALLVALGISGDIIVEGIVTGLGGFFLISCLILNNNFVGEMVLTVLSWGFVRMPGLIFTLDLEGIIWLLTVKLLFWLLGIVLAILAGTLALLLGAAVSVFVYPFALYKNFKHPGETEE